MMTYEHYCAFDFTWKKPASVAQLDAPSDWRQGGRGFNPRRGRQHSFDEIDHEIFSTVILSLPFDLIDQIYQKSFDFFFFLFLFLFSHFKPKITFTA